MRRLLFRIVIPGLLFVLSLTVQAETKPPNMWGIAMGYRIAEIPFASAQDRVSDVTPLFYYDGDYAFLRGLTAGLKFIDKDRWRVSAIGRYRFFDIPAEFQNEIPGDGLDIGLQTRYRFTPELFSDLELLSDDEGRLYSTLSANYEWSPETGNCCLMLD
jgi:outer membrane protein